MSGINSELETDRRVPRLLLLSEVATVVEEVGEVVVRITRDHLGDFWHVD